MIEIMGKIVLCLIIALLLGFLIGWLFSKALGTKENSFEKNDTFDELYNKLDSDFAELEVKYNKEKAMVSEYLTKNRELKGELMKKIALLENTSTTLKNLQASTLAEQDKRGTLGENKITELKKLLAKKNRELLEFEAVLVKAEETIEELRSKWS